MDFTDLSKGFAKNRLLKRHLKENPIDQLLEWIKLAKEEGLSDFNAMALATATKEGKPSCRTVLLKYIDNKGLIFFTNYESRKAQEIKDNPFSMVTFFWKELMRQISVEGTVEKISLSESETYFIKRPRGSQISAWASPQGKTIASYEELKEKYVAIEEKFKGQKIPLPPFWGGFRVLPSRFEFWNGGKDRLHDRFQYILDKEIWKIERLAP